ncbi:MAG TPA: hypothetical protein VKU39_10145, partial [Streptosporangiaceae bacterium]|nr:hypothetical protein [Streptosporangiaceae bacterium]
MRPSVASGGLGNIFNGIAESDVEFIVLATLVAGVAITLLAVFLMRVLAARSIVVTLMVIVLVSVFTALAGVGLIDYRMLTGTDKKVVLELMAIAGLAGLIVPFIVGRRLVKASRSLSEAVDAVGD